MRGRASTPPGRVRSRGGGPGGDSAPLARFAPVAAEAGFAVRVLGADAQPRPGHRFPQRLPRLRGALPTSDVAALQGLADVATITILQQRSADHAARTRRSCSRRSTAGSRSSRRRASSRTRTAVRPGHRVRAAPGGTPRARQVAARDAQAVTDRSPSRSGGRRVRSAVTTDRRRGADRHRASRPWTAGFRPPLRTAPPSGPGAGSPHRPRRNVCSGSGSPDPVGPPSFESRPRWATA